MTSLRKLFVFGVFLPGLAAAADSAMFELVMPDAKVVMEINVDRIVASPIGQAMSDQMKTQIQSMKTDWQQPLAGFNGLDWSHFAQEVLFASNGTQNSGLVIVRGLIDPAWVESLNTFRGTKASFMGVPILTSNGGTSVIAFIDGSIAVAGRDAEVKAAIRRRGQNTPAPPALAEGIQRFEGQYDIWLVSTASMSGKTAVPASMKWLEHVENVSAGVRMNPDVEINADVTMRSEKDVAELSNGLKWLSFVGQTQDRTAGLDNMKMQVDGRHLSFTLQIPEQEIRAALKQRNVGQRSLGPRATAAAPAEISNGLPDPPAGTIRVQSSPSDMGTQLVTVGKNQ